MLMIHTQETGIWKRYQKTGIIFTRCICKQEPETDMADENNAKIDAITAACFIAAINNWQWHKLNNLENNTVLKNYTVSGKKRGQ